jgi:hypothetical protein
MEVASQLLIFDFLVSAAEAGRNATGVGQTLTPLW